ncbi:restriction endonuclease type II-like protein [Ochromonadaceae sp. CCMP2298]|nr:restriction endonuclease type II-like protein [Ochromonadaceae sp. CCMP2298]
MAAANAGNLLVHEVQKGNPVLKHIKNVRWEFSQDIVPDYQMNSTCALFLSVQFHFRHPTHITKRIQEVGRKYRLKILLVLVDDENNVATLQELNKIAFACDFTMILAWSNLECARYLETFKSYEGKAATSIQEKVETEFLPKLSGILTKVGSVNKTDVQTLMSVFGTLGNICNASQQELVLCPGMGDKKVKRLHRTLHEPFMAKRAKESAASSSSHNASIAAPISASNEGEGED